MDMPPESGEDDVGMRGRLVVYRSRVHPCIMPSREMSPTLTGVSLSVRNRCMSSSSESSSSGVRQVRRYSRRAGRLEAPYIGAVFTQPVVEGQGGPGGSTSDYIPCGPGVDEVVQVGVGLESSSSLDEASVYGGR